jgi:hypothetical protein
LDVPARRGSRNLAAGHEEHAVDVQIGAAGGAALITERVRRLIADHISSVEQLEILLLLREAADRDWTAEQVNERIRSSLSSVAARLADLETRGFIVRAEGGYRYGPPAAEAAGVDDLAAAYAERRYTVIELIFSRPSDKLRIFARAFRLRGDGDG